MSHKAIDQILARADQSKNDSDFTYFFDLLLVAEAITKTVTLGMLAAINIDADRNKYRIEHRLARADGIGDWARAIEDLLSGTASQYLNADARIEQSELTKLCRADDWQFLAVTALKNALDSLGIAAEDVPAKSDMKRWFRLLATLRNKTKAHGATKAGSIAEPAEYLRQSIDIFYKNYSLFQRTWVYLHRNLSGKYRVSPISGGGTHFDDLKKETDHTYKNGIYIFWEEPRYVSLVESDAELSDFYFANGSLSGKYFELLSYLSDDKKTAMHWNI